MVSKKYKIFIILTIIIAIISVIIIWSLKQKYSIVTINDNKIKVELANNMFKQYKGLSDRNHLCQNCGMLFVFPDKSKKKFVMRDMRFPLDILFINDNKIVKINEKLMPEGHQTKNIYSSQEPVNYVLELNGAYVSEHNIKVGDIMKFK